MQKVFFSFSPQACPGGFSSYAIPITHDAIRECHPERSGRACPACPELACTELRRSIEGSKLVLSTVEVVEWEDPGHRI